MMQGDPQAATELLAQQQQARSSSERVSLSSLHALMQACLKTGGLLGLIQAEACLAVLRSQGRIPDQKFFSLLLRTCAEAGAVEKADNYLQQMSKAGVKADLGCYNAQVKACVKSGQLTQAEHWLERMGRAEGIGGPNVLGYQLIFGAY